MDYYKRNKDREHYLPHKLWRKLENVDVSNIESLIGCIEKCVSNGWIGEASCISDILSSNPIIDKNPLWRIRFEIERMKRYHYFGMNIMALKSSNDTLRHIENNKCNIPKEKYCEWKFTAIGHMGWIQNDKRKLQFIISSCENALNQAIPLYWPQLEPSNNYA